MRRIGNDVVSSFCLEYFGPQSSFVLCWFKLRGICRACECLLYPSDHLVLT